MNFILRPPWRTNLQEIRIAAIVGTLLEPILIITLGLCVAFVAFSLIMPYFKMAGVLGGIPMGK